MYCPYCGAELPDGAEFCTLCGKKISHAHLRQALAEEGTASDFSSGGTAGSASSAAPNTAPNGFDLTKNGKSIASFVLGIIGFLLPVIGTVCAVIGLILGIITLVKRQGTQWMAVVGIVLSALSLLSIIFTIIIGAVVIGSLTALII